MQIDMNALNQLNVRPQSTPNAKDPLMKGHASGAEARRAPRYARSRQAAEKRDMEPRQQSRPAEQVGRRPAREDRPAVEKRPAVEERRHGAAPVKAKAPQRKTVCHKPQVESDFDAAYKEVAQANVTAQKVTESAVEKQSDTQAVVTENHGPAEVHPEVLDAPIIDMAQELAQKLNIDSVEGLMEVLMAQQPNAQVLDAAEQSGLLDINPAELQGIEGLDAQGHIVTAGQVQKQEAWMMIRQSLTVVSQTLHLNVAEQVKDVGAANTDEYVVRQFADILYALKMISGMLEDAVKENVALEVQQDVLEPQQAVAMEKVVRFEMFRLQFAFRMLGVAGQVNTQAAELQNLPVYQGIPQASDLAAVSQSSVQIRQFFANLIDNTEEQIKTVIARLVNLAQSQQKEPAIDEKSFIAKLQFAHLPHESKPVEFTSFDSLVLRRLLKIDGGGENAAPAPQTNAALSASKEGAPVVFAGQFNASYFKQTFQLQQVVTTSSASTENQSGMAEFMNRITMPSQSGDVIGRATMMPYRTWDESIMNQIADRFNMALKNGMHEARIHLKPESLGDVHLKIQVEGDVVTAKIQVESQQVRQIVESNLQQLRNSLAEHNLQAGAFDVNVQSESGARPDQLAGNGPHGRAAGYGSDEDGGSGDAEDRDADLEIGSETGRRFGSNTIEYFA